MRRKHALLTMGIAALMVTGCGDLAESALESAVERGVEAAVEADNNGEDVEFDLDLSEGTAEVQVGDDVGAIGANLDRPEWLDGGFDLPDDIVIVSYATEADQGTSFIIGVVEGGIPSEFIAHQEREAEGIGFDVVDDWGNENRFRAIHDDGRVMEGQSVGTEGVYNYTLTFFDADSGHSTNAIEAATRSGDEAGTATATIGELTIERTGECVINGDRYNFTSDDGELTAGVQGADGEYRVAASVTDYRDLDNAGAWVPVQDQKTVQVDGNTFSIAGPFTNMFNPDEAPRPGIITVDCG